MLFAGEDFGPFFEVLILGEIINLDNAVDLHCERICTHEETY